MDGSFCIQNNRSLPQHLGFNQDNFQFHSDETQVENYAEGLKILSLYKALVAAQQIVKVKQKHQNKYLDLENAMRTFPLLYNADNDKQKLLRESEKLSEIHINSDDSIRLDLDILQAKVDKAFDIERDKSFIFKIIQANILLGTSELDYFDNLDEKSKRQSLELLDNLDKIGILYGEAFRISDEESQKDPNIDKKDIQQYLSYHMAQVLRREGREYATLGAYIQAVKCFLLAGHFSVVAGEKASEETQLLIRDTIKSLLEMVASLAQDGVMLFLLPLIPDRITSDRITLFKDIVINGRILRYTGYTYILYSTITTWWAHTTPGKVLISLIHENYKLFSRFVNQLRQKIVDLLCYNW